ncbi:fimbrillin family protein [Bacteroides ilei]|uniref:fimbrillin family protein n=1 Tax=Bacteroides ilei TaxID=1907658 RepID=UPI000930400B|nr:fimbrillin family protein [Bacteroides ilei]
MKRYITFISCFIILCGLLGCTDERWLENGSAAENAGGLPIEFVMDLAPIQPVTRADGTTNYGQKTEFVKDDIIQIVANFYKKSETSDDTFELMQGKSVSCILTYNGEKWEDKSGANLYWPWDSEIADFTAFYYPGFDGVLSVGSTPSVLLDSLEVTTDPLMAKVSDISYGNAVSLKFEHKCARLILTDLDAVTGGASYSELWMENLNSNTDNANTNAFSLKLSNTDKELSLGFNFETVRDENDRVLIGGKTAVDENNEDVANSMLFFLPPGNYSKVTLTRRFGHPLFSWDSVDDLNKLEAGKSYIVSLKDLLGYITIDNDDDWWDDENENYIKPEEGKFNLNDFLECVGNGRSYSYYEDGKRIVVLEKITDKYIALKKNIDFDFQEFTLRNIDTGITFDGDGHFFKNVTHNSIFNKIDGNVMNLGIIDSEVTNISLTEEEVGAQGDYKANMFGLLARECLGNIDRIRLSNITINVSSLEEGGTFMVGALVGENNLSPITNIEVNGNITVTVNDKVSNGSMILGGLVGQNGKDASLESVTVYDNAKISVTNNTQITKGSVYTGGLVGLSSSDIKNCKVLADVDASGATGIWVYTGGVVGSLRNSTDSDGSETLDTTEEKNPHIKLENSQNIGTVIGGRCLQNVTEDEAASGHSSTGGLVGYSLRADITNSLVSGTVSSTIEVEEGKSEYYTIGGVVGAVRAVKSGDVHDYPVVRDNSIYANVKSQPNETFCFVGWLAGIAPQNIIEQTNLNSLYVVTELGKVGRIDDSAPGE